MRLNRPKSIIKLSLIVIFILYVHNVLYYAKRVDEVNQKIIIKHAYVLFDDIWRFDKSSAQKYLSLAIEANYYKSVAITLSNKEKYLSIHAVPERALEKLLVQCRLIWTKEYHAEIIEGNHNAGRLSAVVYIRTIYYCFNLFLIYTALFLIIAFITYLLSSKRRLNRAVLDRTAELKAREHELQTVLATSPVGLGMVNDRKLVWGNASMYRMFGYEQGALSGKNARVIYPDENEFERVGKLLYAGMLESGTGQTEAQCIKKDGTIFDCLIQITSLEKSDSAKGHIVAITDFTEQKRAEKERAQLQAQLSQTQKIESIGTLSGGIAHDFNNILFPIIGYTQMLLTDTPPDSPSISKLEKIYSAAIRAKDLIQQILTFARQDSSELKRMKLQPILKEALKLLRATIPTTININQQIDPECGVIKADPTQIHQIVINLMTNASHAMEEAGGKLTVTLKEVEFEEYDTIVPKIKQGIYSCLTVADTGIGMHKEILEKIFDPFFTTKEKGKGTGMGLSVVHGIVNHMGGTIQVYSEPGKGTEFKVYFPVERDSLEDQTITSKEPIVGGNERILLVDDEETLIEMEKEMLERLDYQVTSYASSIEALEIFQTNPNQFDLVITDMAMPGLAGDKLTVELKKIRPDIPILLCTGFSEIMSEDDAVSKGVDGFLMKPVTMRELSKKIRELLDAAVDVSLNRIVPV